MLWMVIAAMPVPARRRLSSSAMCLLKATNRPPAPFSNFAASTSVVVLPDPATALTMALPVPVCIQVKMSCWYLLGVNVMRVNPVRRATATYADNVGCFTNDRTPRCEMASGFRPAIGAGPARASWWTGGGGVGLGCHLWSPIRQPACCPANDYAIQMYRLNLAIRLGFLR
jgi:hypothetical protein